MEVEFAPAFELDPQVKEEGYVGLLVRVSLLLLSSDIPLEVQQHGDKLRQHLLKFRHEELSSADLLNLTVVELVVSPDENHKSPNAKEQNKNRRSLLVLAAKNNLRSLDEEETETDGSSHSSSSNKSGSTFTTSNWCSSESSRNNNVSCMGSFELSFDARTDCDESELEVQRLMSIDIFDNNEVDGDPEDQVDPKDHDDFDNRITISKKFADIVHPQMLRLDGKAYSHQVKACLLFAEHNILCQAFVILSRLRDTKYKGILGYLMLSR